MGSDLGSVSTHPFPELGQVPSSGWPEVAQIGHKDPQIFRVFLTGQPKVHSFMSLGHIKAGILHIVKVRILFKDTS